MKRSLLYFAMATCLLIMAGCAKDETGIIPSNLSNVRTEERPGGIFVQWDKPSDNTVMYVRVSYYDHLLKKDVSRLSSCDTILLPNTRHKYGEYKMAIQPFSSTDTAGKVESLTGTSGKAPVTTVASQLTLKASDLSTNAQEASEGPIANLLDGNTSTYFHTTWNNPPAAPHWMQVNLPQEITEFYRFFYAPRNNANNKPTDFDLMGSSDGTTWFLLKNFTKEADNLPVTATGTYTSGDLSAEEPFKYIRFSVNKTNSGSVFWTMSEFKFYAVKIVDPEAETGNK
ncbi:discoidin domain-containing protein [Bacteroides sp.]|uniref:discoidin domain-containing protein n=1 Tax=Bacteroides sp. TaxID=29523 RepID=UPI002FC8AA53